MHVSFGAELARLRADTLIAEAQPREQARRRPDREVVVPELGMPPAGEGESFNPWHRDPFEAVLSLGGITLLLAFALGGTPWVIGAVVGVGLGLALRAWRRSKSVEGARPGLMFEEKDRWRAWRIVEPDSAYLRRR